MAHFRLMDLPVLITRRLIRAKKKQKKKKKIKAAGSRKRDWEGSHSRAAREILDLREKRSPKAPNEYEIPCYSSRGLERGNVGWEGDEEFSPSEGGFGGGRQFQMRLRRKTKRTRIGVVCSPAKGDVGERERKRGGLVSARTVVETVRVAKI